MKKKRIMKKEIEYYEIFDDNNCVYYTNSKKLGNLINEVVNNGYNITGLLLCSKEYYMESIRKFDK